MSIRNSSAPQAQAVDHTRKRRTYYRHRRNHLEQIRQQTLEQASRPLAFERLLRYIVHTGVSARMIPRPLTLQPSTQQIDGIDGTSADRPTKATHERQREVARHGVFFVLVQLRRHVALHDVLFERLEREEVDGGVGEHAEEAEGQAAVEGLDAVVGPHVSCCGPDKFIPVEAAFECIALHAELECVDWVDDCLGEHARHAAGDKLHGLRNVFGIVVAFEPGDGLFSGLCILSVDV